MYSTAPARHARRPYPTMPDAIQERFDDADEPFREEPAAAAPVAKPRRRRRFGRFLATAFCLLYAIGAVAIYALFRVEGETWWPATFLLFSPRWLWAVPLPLAMLLVLAFRPRFIWFPLLTGAFVLFGLMGFCLPWRTVLTGARGNSVVRIVTANLHGRQANPTLVNNFLTQTQPDVVAFQVYDHKMIIPYLHQPGWKVMVKDGIMVASRWPITPIETSTMGEPPESADELTGGMTIDGAAGRYTVHAPWGDFQLVSLHLTSPHQALDMMKRQGNLAAHLLAANSVRRANSSAALATAVRQTPGPVLLAGDFNTTDDSPIFRTAWSPYNDAFSVAGFGFGTSYSRHHTWLRIDHVLYDPGWTCHASYTSQEIGSGHSAVFAELSR